MLRRKKKYYSFFFFFLCNNITFTNYFPPFTWLWPHSCFWQMEKHEQAAANQVPPKPASLAPASQAAVLLGGCQSLLVSSQWTEISALASQNSQHIPHSGFGNRVRSLGEKKLQEKSCVPVPSRVWWGWIGGSGWRTASSGPAWRTTRAHRTHLVPNPRSASWAFASRADTTQGYSARPHP